VCKSCWCAVLDLSICWVCGECVVRGEEVVSLGWCFWHMSCFGCLLCGKSLSGKGYWRDNDGSADVREGNEKNKERGVELDMVPLCDWCGIETAGYPAEAVLEKGLKNVSRRDGGLTRDRLKGLEDEGVAGLDGEDGGSGSKRRKYSEAKEKDVPKLITKKRKSKDVSDVIRRLTSPSKSLAYQVSFSADDIEM